MRPGGLDLNQGREHFAVDDGAAVFFFQYLRRDSRFMRGECFFDLRLTGNTCEPLWFGRGGRASSQKKKIAAIAGGKCDGDYGRDASRATGDDDDIAGDQGGLTDFTVEGRSDESWFASAGGGEADFERAFEQQLFGDLFGEWGGICAGLDIGWKVEGFAGDVGPFEGGGFDEAGKAAGERAAGRMAVEGE